MRTKKGEEPHPLVSSLAPRIQFLGKVSQVVVVVEVAEGNQILEEDQRYLRDEKEKEKKRKHFLFRRRRRKMRGRPLPCRTGCL